MLSTLPLFCKVISTLLLFRKLISLLSIYWKFRNFLGVINPKYIFPYRIAWNLWNIVSLFTMVYLRIKPWCHLFPPIHILSYIFPSYKKKFDIPCLLCWSGGQALPPCNGVISTVLALSDTPLLLGEDHRLHSDTTQSLFTTIFI